MLGRPHHSPAEASPGSETPQPATYKAGGRGEASWVVGDRPQMPRGSNVAFAISCHQVPATLCHLLQLVDLEEGSEENQFWARLPGRRVRCFSSNRFLQGLEPRSSRNTKHLHLPLTCLPPPEGHLLPPELRALLEPPAPGIPAHYSHLPMSSVSVLSNQ